MAAKARKVNPSIAALKRHAEFVALIKKHGLPAGERRGNPFQSLVRSIVYQQVSGKAAATILARFVGLFAAEVGDTAGKGYVSASFFPTPEQVSAMPVEALRSAGLSGQKLSYIKDLAQKFAAGSIRHGEFAAMTNEEVIVHLLQVKGIGVWTAQMFLISTLGRPDILPTGDLGIQKGFQIVYGLKKLPTQTQMERLAKPWRAHASAGCWYLWRAADEAKLAPKRAVSPKLKEIEKVGYTSK